MSVARDVAWDKELHEQLDWHWREHLRPRLDGLTDEEYFWEPVPGCWNVRKRGEADPGLAIGEGEYTIDYAFPEPRPAPFTTIAWRLGHVIVGVFGARTAAHFGGAPCSYPSHPYAGSASEALKQLDDVYEAWSAGVRGLGVEGMARPCGPAEGPYAEAPMAALVLHINREALHHGAEIALLRDLWAHQR
ncbi:DinB family protein [Nonomuraea sp. NPDC059194]|uniref:DinB family protein n=1 Tax=Nonomuraea sp. NPDC059194 TaxID=3346764 RepID=UPI0036C1D45F